MPRSICLRCGGVSRAVKSRRHGVAGCHGDLVNVDYLPINYPSDIAGYWEHECYQLGYEHAVLNVSPEAAQQSNQYTPTLKTPAYRRGYEAGRGLSVPPNHHQPYKVKVTAVAQVELEVDVWANSPDSAAESALAKADTGDITAEWKQELLAKLSATDVRLSEPV